MKAFYVVGSALLIASVVPGLFWLNGFDFNQRGDTALGCALVSIFVFIVSLSVVAGIVEDKP